MTTRAFQPLAHGPNGAPSLLADREPGYACYALDPSLGHGWTDHYGIAHGISLARGQYTFARPFGDHYTEQPGCLTLKIMLTGELRLRAPGQRRSSLYRGCGVMLRHARQEQTLQREMAGEFRGVSIDVPGALLEQLFDERTRSLLEPDGAEILLDRGHRCHAYALTSAANLLAFAVDTTVGRLHAEAAALQLVATLAEQHPWQTQPRLPQRQRVAVEDARDILHAEFAASHSIAALARRVGLNECYLKSAFKIATGQTIAQYLRQLRMQRARQLIENGECSVLQACHFVGYCNPGQFAAAFRKVHGLAPASLKQPLRARSTEGLLAPA